MQKSPNILRYVVTRAWRTTLHKHPYWFKSGPKKSRWFKRYVHKAERHEGKINLRKGNNELPLKKPYILSQIQTDWT
jgi:hypothetical protein